MSYDPQNFGDLYQAPLGQELWPFLNEPANIIRMETATFLRKPAVEPLSPVLLERFGEAVLDQRIKQLVGHMVRQILEGRGYVVDRTGVRITRQNIFASGTRYREPSRTI